MSDPQAKPVSLGLTPEDRPVDVTVKETIESLIVALILALVFRSYVVEAFVIPTGSMAPTLLGQHVPVTDPQTGYRFTVGLTRGAPGGLLTPTSLLSPMTGAALSLDAGTTARAGDRILVLKYIYMLLEPRRWDVVVFKAPHDPEQNYIKRLIGLPEEDIALLDGNVYVRPAGAERFTIARKIDRPDVQRAVFQPIYHSIYVPLPGADDDPLPWISPWQPQDPGWDVAGRTYRYRPRSPGASGTIQFDFAEHGHALAAMTHPYNQMPGTGMMLVQPIEDIRLAATVRPAAADVGVTLRTTAPLDRPGAAPQQLEARIDADGVAQLVALDADTGAQRVLAGPVQLDRLRPGRATRLELWYVDQAALLWVDGEEVLRFTWDLPLAMLQTRPRLQVTPDVAITVHGGAAALDDVQLDRDLYYGTERDGLSARGALDRRHLRRPAEGQPLHIPADAYWCLGDNSPLSDDGRFWPNTNPWVRERFFGPSLADPAGLVPRRLLIGRAFFVYLPAPLPLRPGGAGVLPNFGAMRLIR